MGNNVQGIRQVVPKLGLRETRLVLDNLSKLEQRFQHDGQRVLLKTKFVQSLLSTTSGSIDIISWRRLLGQRQYQSKHGRSRAVRIQSQWLPCHLRWSILTRLTVDKKLGQIQLMMCTKCKGVESCKIAANSCALFCHDRGDRGCEHSSKTLKFSAPPLGTSHCKRLEHHDPVV